LQLPLSGPEASPDGPGQLADPPKEGNRMKDEKATTEETQDVVAEPTEAKSETKPKKKAANRMTEEELIQDYPHVAIVPGSLSFIESENKQAVKITCSVEGCERTRTVRTSDLHQADKCEVCTRKARRERQRQRRKEKKAAEKAEDAS
jgi:hypothetical protein